MRSKKVRNNIYCVLLISWLVLALQFQAYAAFPQSINPRHDVAVINVIPWETIVSQGDNIKINVTIENRGDFSENNLNVTLYATGSGIFSDSGQNLGNAYTRGAALGDLDGDGDLDAFTIPGRETSFNIWLNDGQGIFSESSQKMKHLELYNVVLGDLDGDGDLDAFTANEWQPNIVLLNDGTGNFSDSGEDYGDKSFFKSDVALGDLDGDGDLDAFSTHYGQPNWIWVNNGTGYFFNSGQTLGGEALYDSDSEDVSLGDLDGDGDLDAFVINDNQPDKVYLNDGLGLFSDSGQNLSSSYNSRELALGDLDGDNDLDVFKVNTDNKPNEVWLNDGYGNFGNSNQSIGRFNSVAVALGDFDGDNDLDAFVINPNQISKVYLNSGNGVFFDSGQTFSRTRSYDVALGDLDGDHDLDAFLAIYNRHRPDKVLINLDILLQSLNVFSLDSRDHKTLTFTWNTSNFDKGVYTLKAISDIVSGETDVGNNIFVDGVVTVGDFGDVTPPFADAGNDQTVNEDTVVTFNGSSSYDNVLITSYIWTFTDGIPQTLIGEIVIYNFTNPSTYLIVLNITDNAGNFDTDNVTIYVKDATPPFADGGNDQAVRVNTLVFFNADKSKDNVDIIKYEWDFGDGTSGVGLTTTHRYTQTGVYTVTLTALDKVGNSNEDVILINVQAKLLPWPMIGIGVTIVGITIVVIYFMITKAD